MKLELNELIEAVKEELLCYEDMEAAAEAWVKEFLTWTSGAGKKELVEEKGKLFFRIQDEDEIFEMADSYIDALEEGAVKAYWEKF